VPNKSQKGPRGSKGYREKRVEILKVKGLWIGPGGLRKTSEARLGGACPKDSAGQKRGVALGRTFSPAADAEGGRSGEGIKG